MSEGHATVRIIKNLLVTFVFYFYKSKRNQLTSFISNWKYRYEWVNAMRHKITLKLVDKYIGTELRPGTDNKRLDLPPEHSHQELFERHISGNQLASNSVFFGSVSNIQVNSSATRKLSGKSSTSLLNVQCANTKNSHRALHDIFRSPLDAQTLPKPVMRSKLAEREKFKSALLSAAPDCIITIGQHGEILGFNRAAELAFNYRSDDVLGKNFLDMLIAPESREELQQNINRFFPNAENTCPNHRIESKAIRACSGTMFPIEITIVPLTGQSEPCVAAFIRDISGEKRAEALQLGQNRILHLIATGVTLREILTEIALFAEKLSDDGHCTILQLNETGTKFVGGVAASLPCSFVSQIVESTVAPCNDSCGTAVFYPTPVVVRDIATDPICIASCKLTVEHGLHACTSWPIFGKGGKALGTFTLYFRGPLEPASSDSQVASICANLAGIAIESRASEERIRYLAHYDGLTSLPNRFLFEEYLDVALRHAQRSGNKFALLFVDLDKFKEINDTLGHDAGDQVLREIGTRMRNCLRHTDKIARMGGDEFYVLIADLNESHYASDIAQKLLQEVIRPVDIQGKDCYVSASIGISIYPGDGDSAHTLLQNADKAMYRVKNDGKNGYQFFSSDNHHELMQ